jgi:hypothetical protein
MRRLWLTWAWTRLTRQHRTPWWRVRAELDDAIRWATIAEALQREIVRHRAISAGGGR